MVTKKEINIRTFSEREKFNWSREWTQGLLSPPEFQRADLREATWT